MTEPLLAYSMSHDEKGWAWNVYDEAGEIVASGLDACQETAKAAVCLLYTSPSPRDS